MKGKYLVKMETSVPIIDVSPYLTDSAAASEVVEKIRIACEEIGFLVITGHGVPGALLREMRRVSAQFFDLTVEEKLKCEAVPGESLGYVPMNTEYLAATQGHKTPPDLKESFDIRRPETPETDYYLSDAGRYFFRRFVWPDRPIDFREIWSTYYSAMSELSTKIMQIFAEALRLPKDYFETRLDKSVDFLRVINYPAQATLPEDGQLRAGEHTDYGTLTLVAVENVDGGLQVKAKNGTWIDVPAIPDSFVLNIGDMMSHWTSGQWVSTLHRVVNPTTKSGAQTRRQSVVFFQNPNYDTLLEPLGSAEHELGFEAVEAGAWLRNKSMIAKSKQ